MGPSIRYWAARGIKLLLTLLRTPPHTALRLFVSCSSRCVLVMHSMRVSRDQTYACPWAAQFSQLSSAYMLAHHLPCTVCSMSTPSKVLCFQDGMYVSHHGKLGASRATGGGSVTTEVERWVRTTEAKLRDHLQPNVHCGGRHCRLEDPHTHSDDEFTHDSSARSSATRLSMAGRPSATAAVTTNANVGSDSDSDDASPRQRGRRGQGRGTTVVRVLASRPSRISDDDDDDIGSDG